MEPYLQEQTLTVDYYLCGVYDNRDIKMGHSVSRKISKSYFFKVKSMENFLMHFLKDCSRGT